MSVIGVLFGLVGSSLILYMGVVFGSIAFMDDTAKFKNVVLSIAGGCYVFYLAVVVILPLKRSMSAAWVAWAPFLIVVVLGPSLQLFRGLGS